MSLSAMMGMRPADSTCQKRMAKLPAPRVLTVKCDSAMLVWNSFTAVVLVDAVILLVHRFAF
jgi:hypothetical protein